MKLYQVRVFSGSPEYVEILSESPAGFEILIKKTKNNQIKEYKDFISRALFESCIRTQYLVEAEGSVAFSA